MRNAVFSGDGRWIELVIDNFFDELIIFDSHGRGPVFALLVSGFHWFRVITNSHRRRTY